MPELPANYELLELTFHEPREIAGRLVIGGDQGVAELCLIEGAVWSIDPAGKLRPRLVNSTIEQLTMAIEAHRQACEEAEQANSVVDSLLAVETLAAKLNCIDTEAMANGKNFWPVIVEQIRDGLA